MKPGSSPGSVKSSVSLTGESSGIDSNWAKYDGLVSETELSKAVIVMPNTSAYTAIGFIRLGEMWLQDVKVI